MLKKLVSSTAIAVAMIVGLSFSGCSMEGDEGNLPPTKPKDASELKADQKKMLDSMKGMYKGAPGIPLKKQ